jgi:membrane-bound lytic murein transglycosylase MltF
MVVVDEHKAKFWAQVFPNIAVRSDLVVHEGGQIAWAVRKKSPLLLEEINAFIDVQVKKQGLGRELLKRYLQSTRYVKNATSKSEMERFNQVVWLFKKYGEQYNFEYLMLMAQGYQESRLNQAAVSPKGAVGIMQLLPSTAENPPVKIDDVDKNPENNIHAGAKYLRWLIDTYLSDPDIDRKNRLLMAFAAYNAGPGNLRKFRQLAKKMDLNPNVWFQNVEHAAARIVGRETVQYVSNIYKYYIAYKLTKEQQSKRTTQFAK